MWGRVMLTGPGPAFDRAAGDREFVRDVRAVMGGTKMRDPPLNSCGVCVAGPGVSFAPGRWREATAAVGGVNGLLLIKIRGFVDQTTKIK